MYQDNIIHLKFTQYSIQLFINPRYLSMIFKVQLLNISVSIVLKKKNSFIDLNFHFYFLLYGRCVLYLCIPMLSLFIQSLLL